MPTLDKIGSWTRQGAIDKLRWTIEEKYKMTEEEMLRTMNKKWLVENGFETPLHYMWEGVVFCMLEDVYPNRYMPWDYAKTPNGFWTKETTIIYFRWLVLDKYQYTKEQFLQIYSWDWVRKKTKLSASIERRWDNDLQKILADAFPEWVSESVILRKVKRGKRVASGYWTKERTFKMLDDIVKEEGMDRDDIVKTINTDWMSSRGLRSPLQNIWGGKLRDLFDDWKPGEYKIWEFSRLPRGYWTKETATQYLRWLVLDKNNYTKDEFVAVYSSEWLKKARIRDAYLNIWDGGVEEMFKEAFPEWVNN